MTKRWFDEPDTDNARLAQEAEEVQLAEEFDAWRAEFGLDMPPEGDAWEEFLRDMWERRQVPSQYDGPEEDDIAF